MATDQDERTAARRAGEPGRWDHDVLNSLMGTPQGQFWMERLLDFCGAGRPVYFDDGDALGMAKRDGRADVGRYLQTQLEEHCPDLYLRMVRARRARLERERDRAAKEEARRQGTTPQHSGVTTIEELADQQARAAAEEAERTAKAKPTKKD